MISASQPLEYRCLALTGSFETSAPPPDCFSGLAGHFDGQGISFGALQWNLGQNTLQPLLTDMLNGHRQVCERIFSGTLAELRKVLNEPVPRQLSWAAALQKAPRYTMREPWRQQFIALGATPEFQALQVRAAARIYRQARQLCSDYKLWSERAVALMFDICVQNGSIGAAVRTQILAGFVGLPASDPSHTELRKMQIIAQRRAAAARPQFRMNVLRRKLTIAEGSGTVNGSLYNLEKDFGLRLITTQAEPLAA